MTFACSVKVHLGTSLTCNRQETCVRSRLNKLFIQFSSIRMVFCSRPDIKIDLYVCGTSELKRCLQLFQTMRSTDKACLTSASATKVTNSQLLGKVQTWLNFSTWERTSGQHQLNSQLKVQTLKFNLFLSMPTVTISLQPKTKQSEFTLASLGFLTRPRSSWHQESTAASFQAAP